jgi:DNA-binding MarR family transcriptional regulator
MKSRESAPETSRILDDLRRIVRVLRESSRTAERELGVSGAQLFALKVVAQVPSLSLGEVAVRTRTHQSTVSVVVKRLVAAGLVRKVADDDDARRVVLQVTERGRALLRRAPEAGQERLLAGLARLPQARRTALAAHLGELAIAMGLEGEPAPMFFEDAPRRRSPRA